MSWFRNDGSPSALPRRYRAQREELVRRRLEREGFLRRNMELRQQLAEAQGKDPMDAIFEGLSEGR